jgi:hypothetical protein
MQVGGQIYTPEVDARKIPGTHTVKVIAVFSYFSVQMWSVLSEVTSCEYP